MCGRTTKFSRLENKESMATGMESSHFEIGKERKVVTRLLEWVFAVFKQFFVPRVCVK